MKKRTGFASRLTGAACLVYALLMAVSADAVRADSAFGERITLTPVATVSWDELVAADAVRPPDEDAQPRVIPFMPEPQSQLPALVERGRTPADVLRPPFPVPTVLTPPLGINFQALPDNGLAIPPDTHGAVSTHYVMTMLNSQVRIQDRTGGVVSTVSLGAFWRFAVGNPFEAPDVFDPRLIFDPGANRWLATCMSDRRSDTSSVLFAISASDNPTVAWTYYRIDADPTDVNWADFPDIGYNMTWIAITSNMYTNVGDTLKGPAMWVIDKSTALAGGALTLTFFPIGSDAFGGYSGFTLRVCQTFGAEPNLYLIDRRYRVGGTNVLRLTEITGTGSAPVWSATPGSSIPGYPVTTGWFYVVNDFFEGMTEGASQLGTTLRIETNDARMLNAVYRNGWVWCTHSGGLPTSTPDRTAVFWYQLNPDAMPTPIVQSGVLEGGHDVHYFFPSITANANNDVLIGFSRSDSSRYAEGVYTGRIAADPPGTMGPIVLLKAGEDSYVKDWGYGDIRWGDYSATVVDPVDDLSFWTIQEYAAFDVDSTPDGDRWGTWWGRVSNDTGEATNVVVVDSRSFPTSYAACTIGVWVTNINELMAFVMPLEFRAASPPSYPIAAGFAFNAVAANRVPRSPITGSVWRLTYGAPAATNTCSGPVSSTFQQVSPFDGVSPDGFMWAGVQTNGPPDLWYLPPGTDSVAGVFNDWPEAGATTPYSAGPSFVFVFTTSSSAGFFEVDTCCVPPANHLAGADLVSNLVPFEFVKGVIQVTDYWVRIVSVADVGNDQGRQVRIQWKSLPGDDNFVQNFAIYRRIGPYQSGAKAIDPFGLKNMPPGNWDFVVSVPARGDTIYATVVPTLADSTIAQGMYWSVFFVSAIGDNPTDNFDSPPDSGYSKDNLAPAPPAGLVAAVASPDVDLDWRPVADADFDYYWVYRDTVAGFVPAPLKRIGATSDSSFLDQSVPPGVTVYYKVCAVDFSGNEGGPSNEVSVSLCACPCHGDPVCDGVPNVQDVVAAVNVAFRGSAPVFDPQCPRERTDVNCDGVTDVLDVVSMVGVAFRGADPVATFCDPCT